MHNNYQGRGNPGEQLLPRTSDAEISGVPASCNSFVNKKHSATNTRKNVINDNICKTKNKATVNELKSEETARFVKKK